MGEAMGKDSDETLFERLLAGDQGCLRPLMERHGDALTFYVNGYVHDVDAAEDVMIEAFARMLAKRPRLREGGFKPYLYKTARNLVLRHLRLHARFMSVEDLDGELAGAEEVGEALLRSERDQALYRCLAKLRPEYREALYLVYIEGMGYDEAGAIMGKTRKQIDNLVSRGKAAMRPLLAKEGMFDEID